MVLAEMVNFVVQAPRLPFHGTEVRIVKPRRPYYKPHPNQRVFDS